MDPAPLDRACSLMGILPAFRDISGTEHRLSDEQRRRVLRLLGIQAETDAALLAWLETRAAGGSQADRAGERPLVRRHAAVSLPVDFGAPAQSCEWHLQPDGSYYEISGLGPRVAPPPPRSGRGTVEFTEAGLALRLPALEPGYYRLTLQSAALRREHALIVTPDHAWPFGFERGWGLAVQLYGLHSNENAGPGDLSDALQIGRTLAPHALRTLGLSPVHALFPSNPAHASPYSPSTRLFWNVCFAPGSHTGGEATGSRVAQLGSDNQATGSAGYPDRPALIDYGQLLPARLAQLAQAAQAELHSEDFRTFVSDQGPALEAHALYDALSEHFGEYGNWPHALRSRDGAAVREFALNRRAAIDKYSFFQYRTWRGLNQLVSGLGQQGVSLYLDLAVGVQPTGSEAWSHPELFLPGLSIGAPPDPIAPQGQDWGLAPISPDALERGGYRHFIRMLRANMPPGGMIRMDHAMQLERLYWHVHDGGEPFGGYVRYPSQQLLGILALESRLQRCSVIAEDLGTVPPGFRETLQTARMHTWKVFYFEKDGAEFARPATYPEGTIATLNTHDLPTVLAWWQELDVPLRAGLGLVDDEEADRMRAERARDRRAIVELLVREGLVPEGSDPSSLEPRDVLSLLHELLAGAGSRLVLINLADLLGETVPHNVPGTADRPENWALRYTRGVEDVAGGDLARRLLHLMRAARPRKT